MILSPAAYVIHVMGGVNATARAISRSPAAVSKWKSPRHKKGTGGEVPRKARKLILKYAMVHGLDISADDLEYGRRVRLR